MPRKKPKQERKQTPEERARRFEWQPEDITWHPGGEKPEQTDPPEPEE